MSLQYYSGVTWVLVDLSKREGRRHHCPEEGDEAGGRGGLRERSVREVAVLAVEHHVRSSLESPTLMLRIAGSTPGPARLPGTHHHGI